MARLATHKPDVPLIHGVINKTIVNGESIEAMKPEDNKKVFGEFVNIECPGQPAKISCKYHKWQPYFSKTFQDGEKAQLDYVVARHINERCQFEEHSYIVDDKGNPIKTGKKRVRYKFIIESAA